MAFPTAVNIQITDSVTQAAVQVMGGVSATSMGNLIVATSTALANAAQNASAIQQQANIAAQAATTMGVTQLYSLTSSEIVSAEKHILRSN